MNVDHVGIAVARVADALPQWETALAARAGPVEEVPNQKVRVAFVDAGGTHLELIEPTSADSPIARFLESRGPGLHHLAFDVRSVDAALRAAEAAGARLIDKTARPGSRGRRVGFVHPSGFGGVLVEYVEGP